MKAPCKCIWTFTLATSVFLPNIVYLPAAKTRQWPFLAKISPKSTQLKFYSDHERFSSKELAHVNAAEILRWSWAFSCQKIANANAVRTLQRIRTFSPPRYYPCQLRVNFYISHRHFLVQILPMLNAAEILQSPRAFFSLKYCPYSLLKYYIGHRNAAVDIGTEDFPF